MFNLKVKFLLAVSVLVVGVSAANAQLPNGTVIKANIATEFVVSGQTFPAGNYTIARMPGTTYSAYLMVLRGDNGKSMIFDTMESESGETAKATSLVFENVDGVDFLSKILVGGDNVALEIPNALAEPKAAVLTEAEANIVLVQYPGF